MDAFEAIRQNNIDRLREYIVDADLNVIDPNGDTLVHMAVAWNNVVALRLLVSAGTSEARRKARTDVLNNDDELPIHIAILHNNCDCLNELLTDKDARNSEGMTPIHMATHRECLECLKILIEAGADLNSVDERGYTPLHYAVSWYNLDGVKLLVEAASASPSGLFDLPPGRGADPEIRNRWSETPYEIATKLKDDFYVRGLNIEGELKSQVQIIEYFKSIELPTKPALAEN